MVPQFHFDLTKFRHKYVRFLNDSDILYDSLSTFKMNNLRHFIYFCGKSVTTLAENTTKPTYLCRIWNFIQTNIYCNPFKGARKVTQCPTMLQYDWKERYSEIRVYYVVTQGVSKVRLKGMQPTWPVFPHSVVVRCVGAHCSNTGNNASLGLGRPVFLFLPVLLS